MDEQNPIKVALSLKKPLGQALWPVNSKMSLEKSLFFISETLRNESITESPQFAKETKLLERILQTANLLKKDNWKDEYISEFMRVQVALHEEGIVDLFPKKLYPGNALPPKIETPIEQHAKQIGSAHAKLNCDEQDEWGDEDSWGEKSDKKSDTFLPSAYNMVDAKGKLFDDLRGKNSPGQKFYDWLDKNGGNSQLLAQYFGEQAGDSWNITPRAVKHFLTKNRDLSDDKYWWKKVDKNNDGSTKCKEAYEQLSQNYKGFDISIIAQHAFTYEFLCTTELPNSSQTEQALWVIRTEGIDAMQINNIKQGEKTTYPRGAAESYSIVEAISVHGSELTMTQLPFHRALGVYVHGTPIKKIDPNDKFAKFMIMAQQKDEEVKTEGLFLSDVENEVVAMTDDLPMIYCGGKNSTPPKPPWEAELKGWK